MSLPINSDAIEINDVYRLVFNDEYMGDTTVIIRGHNI